MAETTQAVRSALTEFVRDLYDRLAERKEGSAAHELEVVLTDDAYSLDSVELGSKPETYTEDHLIGPLLDAVGLTYERQPYGERGGTVVWPDLELTNLGTKVIGENKPLNEVDAGVSELKEYLDRKSIGAEYGVVTDGIQWRVFKIELGGDFTEYPEIAQASVDLRPALRAIAREEGLVEQSGLDVDADERIAAFVSAFERESFDHLLSKTAPREIRDRRKRDVEAFYELYIELLFGEGSGEYDYDTCLMDDIRYVGEGEPDERERRLFAITLVNRLLFVKFLENRDVLSEGFLRERVEHYREHGDEFAGNLYETQIRPLFYDLLNTPEGDREPKHRDPDAWFDDVPYLNGGLFRQNVADESRYRVVDRILPDVIRDLIEGSELELDGESFDPALLGSVFEKTINHIEQERTQKDIGAYYTPNDVTEIVTEQSVDPKIRDVLVETFVAAVADDAEDGSASEGELGSASGESGAASGESGAASEGDGSASEGELASASESDDLADVRAYLRGLDLSELLRKIEDGTEAVLSPQGESTRVDFGDEAALERAKANLRELKVLDPACGSGHFLTTAMDEIHRAQVSVLRGLDGGDDPDPETRFAEKKALALNAIYGVDVDRIAAEIAKLRVWLKIVEGNGWEPTFGKLPNIDVNITHGNSLVGLPLAGSFDDADVWSNDIGEIEQRRIEYKRDDEGDPREIERFMDEEIRPALDRKYLDLFSKPVETEIDGVEAFDAVVESIDGDTLYPTVSMVRVARADGDAFTDEQEARLDDMGFSVYTKSATRDVADWERTVKTRENDGVGTGYDKSVLAEKLRSLLEDGYTFPEVQRQPTRYDLQRVTGTPFHWVAEFPEVAEKRGSTHSINFDIVLGNPPYGDLLSDEEKVFVSTYETSDIRDISANFVERQLQLLEDGGYFGNITTLRLVYQSSLTEFHDHLRSQLSQTNIACFAHRPQQVFPNAIVRIALLSGHKTTPEEPGEIRTSKFLQFTSENRQETLANISYRSVEGLELRERIGGEDRSYEVLPKVGTETIENILVKLREKSDRIIEDAESDTQTEYPVFRRRGGGYWLNAVPENIHGNATTIEPIYFENELERQTAFLIVNSSLFYLYWMTYADFRHLNTGHITRFPIPSIEELEAKEDEIKELANDLWKEMQAVHAGGNRDQFDMPQVKPIINKVDVLLADIFDLNQSELDLLIDYNSEYGRSGPENHQLDELEADD